LFIESRYWVHAVPEDEVAPGGRHALQLGERRGDIAQHRSLGVAEHPLPRLLSVVPVGAGKADRVLEVVVMGAEEAQRRLPLGQQVEGRDRAGARRAASRELDLAQLPHLAPGVRVDRGADLVEPPAPLERAALGGGQEVARVVLHRLRDPEEGEELEVEADAHEPAGIGEMLAGERHVLDHRALVEVRLVGPDPQHRVPRVIRRARVGHARVGGLPGGIGGDEPVEQPRVERPAAPQVADQQRSFRARHGHPGIQRSQLHEQPLAEEVAEREGIGAVRGAVAEARVQGVPCPLRAGEEVVGRREREDPSPARESGEPRSAVGARDEGERQRRTILPARDEDRRDRAVGAGEREARADLVGRPAVEVVEKERLILLRARKDQRDLLARAQAGMRRLGLRAPARDERHEPAPDRLARPFERVGGASQHRGLGRRVQAGHLGGEELLEPAKEHALVLRLDGSRRLHRPMLVAILMPPPGIEPGTFGLRVRCSAS
jgi:hypothetical protein